MMSGAKQCASCTKTVYPLEELKCLDKIWHKGCFKCAVCNMTLNMKNYKGYEKQPYCQAHYPQQKHTQVADNPELQRIRENTKIQSNVKYHEEFERSKSQFTPVTDNPEMQRALENQKIASNVSYRGVNAKLQYMEEARQYVEKGSAGREETNGRGRLEATRREASFDGSEVPLYPTSGSFQPEVAPMPKVYFGGNPSVTGPAGGNHAAGAYYQSAPPAARGSFSQQQAVNLDEPRDDYFTEVERIKPPSNGHSVVPDDHPYLQHAPPASSASPPKAFRVRALYDYLAQDTDEVSFYEGDVLSIVEQIDEGWMYGSNPSTGQVGLLPANYVERA